MSTEIIPVEEDSATSSRKQYLAQHQHSSWNLLDPRRAFTSEVSTHLTGGDYHTKQYLASKKGHKYVKLFNPTLASVETLLDKIKEPSVLLLRGCDFLLQSGRFPFNKFKSITTLEISGFPHLANLPEDTVYQMTQLQSLNLSYLQIDHLPDELFKYNAESLRSLVIKGCPNLHVLPQTSLMESFICFKMLKDLDLSYLPIETLPRGTSLGPLRSLILRGCSKLQSLQVSQLLELQFLDLCHCTSLIAENIHIFGTSLVIDLSYTAFNWCDLPENTAISHLFFRNANLCNPEKSFYFTNTMKVCDLSGNQGLKNVSFLERCHSLEALNLSRTGIQSIDFLSVLYDLRTLVLRECTCLKQLPTVERIENLEVLDLSGCEILCDLPQGLSKQRGMKELNLCGCKSLTELVEGLFDDMYSLEKLDLSNTDIKNLPSFDDLINRGTVINHSCDSALESSSSVPTEQSNLCSDEVDSRQEFHLVSNFICDSGFDKFKFKFFKLEWYISYLEEEVVQGVANKEETGVRMQFNSLRVALKYILAKVDLLESSHNCRNSEELLHQLMRYDYKSHYDPSSIFEKLLRTVIKLKLLVPPTPTPPDGEGTDEEGIEEEGIEEKEKEEESYLEERYESEFVNAYESLTPIQRNCLLYFACLNMAISGENRVKENILIQLWYGEGFFDPLLYASERASTSNTYSTIEEIGRDILHALKTEKFIVPEIRELKNIPELNNSFVKKKAMEQHLFDFNERGKLTPHFVVSRRACLLKSAIDHPPSSQAWLNYTKTSGHLESFKNVRTLMYINEPVVDINIEWFSYMANLHVIHLANLDSKQQQQINIVDLKFLEELKRMEQLRVLNLESFAIIEKLPNSICQLTNLGILNLAYCSNLTELPAGIASLTNLFVLDLTECHLLSELPRGLASLSKLEVLKGFPITYKFSDRQSKTACTLRGLLKLKSLRKLNLVVNKDSFPDTMDLQVLRNMKKLRNLKITWEQNICKEQELGDAVQKGALRQSRWKQFKCWGLRNETEEDGLLLTSSCLGNLNKLVLCCFPLQTEPNWLNPTEMQNLERLSIVGGSLRTLFQDNTDRIRWNVKTLKLKYLSNLLMDWLIIPGKFPCLTFCYGYHCPYTKNRWECNEIMRQRDLVS